VQAGKLAELKLELAGRTTFVLSDQNKKFCLGCLGVDGGDDGYSPLGVFGLELKSDGLGEDDGLDEVGDDDVSETGGRVEKPGNQTNWQATRLGATWCAPGAERRGAALGRTGWRGGRQSLRALETTSGLA
jgi:hypothetical protein